jgi:hypothetical protein
MNEIIEMVDKSRENFYKAEALLYTIQQQAYFFEMRTGMRPTIFMSYDFFAILVGSFRDVVAHRLDKCQSAHTVCGYDLEIIAHGKEVLYVGYKINLGERY